MTKYAVLGYQPTTIIVKGTILGADVPKNVGTLTKENGYLSRSPLFPFGTIQNRNIPIVSGKADTKWTQNLESGPVRVW